MGWSPAAQNVVSIFVLVLIISTSLNCSKGQLEITAWTPQEGRGMPDGTTAVLQLATALLGGSTPAMLWGTIPADAVQSICEQVTSGNYDFSATIYIDGDTLYRNMEVTALGGCGAAADGTDGVEAVLLDDEGSLSALICPSVQSDYYGCDIYDTGDDLTSLYNGANGDGVDQDTNTTVNGGGRRKLLGNCFTEGTVQGAKWGFVGGVVAGIFICEGGLNLGCDIAIALAASGAGAGGGVLYECSGSGRAKSGCFPGSTLVTTSLGVSIPISKLALGDKVAVRSHDGSIAFSSVYAFGHADSSTIFPFIQITLQQIESQKLGVEGASHFSSIRVVKLTGDHFIPTISTKGLDIIYKRAREILIGDIIFGTSAHGIINATSTITQFVVKDIVQILEEGLYNPFTLKGDIIIDGVVASTHSEWFLDSTFDSLGISNLLPRAYEGILLPVRILYHILGEDMYNYLYTTLENNIGISTIGNIYVGQITILTILMAGFIVHTITKKQYSIILK
ncbi:hypothetical protein GOP47_0018028 [Adiantum capillus-veneris]|uniref:Hint domain-containing protein n=1 Tax=Adiantum capillus-veneris TaxID=13818 RepID=A0A9D4UGR8_ADICA|nr:hypothetical protein GOP47_0018028 [Adiantum capillus-veneris]